MADIKKKIVFVFPGIGTQWSKMGAELYNSNTIFREWLEKCNSVYYGYSGWSIVERIFKDPDPYRINQSKFAQPCIFAIQLSLSNLLLELGIIPDAVLGHSCGEVPAACFAGALSLRESLRLIYNHTLISEKASGQGKMLFVALQQNEVEKLISGYGSTVEIASISGPCSAVIVGSEKPILDILNTLTSRNIFSKLLETDVAFHSTFIEPYLQAFKKSIADLKIEKEKYNIFSCLTANRTNSRELNPEYWAEHIRKPIKFLETVNNCISEGYDFFIEISPHPTLVNNFNEIFQIQKKTSLVVLSTLKRKSDGKEDLLDLTSKLIQSGCHIDLSKFDLNDRARITKASGKDKSLENNLTDLRSVKSSLERIKILKDIIKDLINRISENKIVPSDEQAGFFAMGLDSLMAVQLKEGLEDKLSLKLSSTVIFNYSNIINLSEYLNSLVQNDPDTSNNNSHLDIGNKLEIDNNEPIAIIGMACRFPGGANTIDKYWELLEKGVDAVTEVPPDRFNIDEYYDPDPTIPGKTVSKWGGFLKDVDIKSFDANFFKITPNEIKALDPQQRLLLEVVWEALENSCIAPDLLRKKKVGVFIGISTDDYKNAHLVSPDLDIIDSYSASGSMFSSAGGRISYFLGFQGPNVSIDTACSSFMSALHIGCQSLRNNECETVIIAGVNLMLTPNLYVYFSKLGAMSPDGRSKAFDSSANGYVRGEGCGVLVLKREKDALLNKDTIYALVKGSALNQDGASSSFIAPNGLAQQQVYTDALKNSRLKPEDVDYIEAHGTGTELGDSIEINSLLEVYGKSHTAENPLMIGSVKTNIGHLEAAAGVGSIIKSVLMLLNDKIPQSLHFKNPNKHVDWQNVNLKVAQSLLPWNKSERVRRIGVSSFGFSGSNSHILIEEAPEQIYEGKKYDLPLHILTISAKNEDALKELSEKYVTFLDSRTDLSIEDICYSANTGRNHFECRVAAIGKNKEEIKEKLKTFIDGTKSNIKCSLQLDNENKSEIDFPEINFTELISSNDKIMLERFFNDLAERYINSLSIDWDGFYKPFLMKKVILPNYPFQRQRYWMDPNAMAAGLINKGKDNKHHNYLLGDLIKSPVINNIVIYQSVFNKNNPDFLKDHIIFDTIISPGAAHVSMVLETLKAYFSSEKCLLNNIEFIKPLSFHFNEKKNVQIIIDETDKKKNSVKICSQNYGVDSSDWDTHFTASLLKEDNDEFQNKNKHIDISGIKDRFSTFISSAEFYRELYKLGYGLGNGFRCINEVYMGEKKSLVYIKREVKDEEQSNYEIHPGIIDSIFQTILSTYFYHYVKRMHDENKILIPIYLAKIIVHRSIPSDGVWCLAKSKEDKDIIRGDTEIYDSEGDLVAEIIDLAAKFTDRKALIERDVISSSNLLYQSQWIEKPLSDKYRNLEFLKKPDPVYLIFSDTKGYSIELARLLKKYNKKVVRIGKTAKSGSENNIEFNLDPLSEKDFNSFFNDMKVRYTSERFEILYLWNLDNEDFNEGFKSADIESRQQIVFNSLLNIIKSLSGLKIVDRSVIRILTRNAVFLGADNANKNYIPFGDQSLLWGFCKSVALEYSDLWGGIIDFDPDENLEPVLYEFQNPDNEKQIVIQKNKRYVQRLQKIKNPKYNKEINFTIKEDCTYLITGGYGALGLLTSKWLTKQGAKYLILTGRSQANSATIEQIEELRRNGTKILLIQSDISKESDCEKLFLTASNEMPQIKGIIHCAGTLNDRLINEHTWESFSEVLKPKVLGTWNLHKFSVKLPLDFFIMYSSAASLFGNNGQSNYVAGNAFIDSLCQYRKQKQLPSLSINWGPWDKVGMALSKPEIKLMLSRQGFKLIAPELNFEILQNILNTDLAQVGIINCDWEKYIEFNSNSFSVNLLSGLLKDHKSDTDGKPRKNELVNKILNSNKEAKEEIIRENILDIIISLLGLPEKEKKRISITKPLFEQGFDSLAAVEFRNSLNKRFDKTLQSSFLFNYPAIGDIVNYLVTDYENLQKKFVEETKIEPTEKSEDTEFDYLNDLSKEDIENLLLKEIEKS